jgi:hypothetical protein
MLGAMAGIDFPKMENRAPEIYISLHLNVKLAATDDKQRNVGSNHKKTARVKISKNYTCLIRFCIFVKNI